MAIGYVALVLHAHLPFVRHPESDYVLEEEWLYEAITETYIPLLQVFEGLKRDGINFKITMSMTPPLVSMLRDPLLQERYSEHLAQLEELVALVEVYTNLVVSRSASLYARRTCNKKVDHVIHK